MLFDRGDDNDDDDGGLSFRMIVVGGLFFFFNFVTLNLLYLSQLSPDPLPSGNHLFVLYSQQPVCLFVVVVRVMILSPLT